MEQSDISAPEGDGSLREYIGLIWIGDEPGVRLIVWARSAPEAEALVRAEYGEGHPMTLWNEEDAAKPRLA